MLADDTYWLFHDDRSGRPRIPVRVVGIAMAAAILAELTTDHLLEITAGWLRPVQRDGVTASTTMSRAQLSAPARPLDSVAAEVLARVVAESEVHPVRDWLAVLSLDSARLVGHRMVAAGVAVERGVRRGLRRDVVFVPVDPIAAAWPGARLSTGVRGQRRLDAGDVFLLGLVAVTPLAEDLLADAPGPVRERVLAGVGDLPRPWWELLESTRVAVASGVMTQRI